MPYEVRAQYDGLYNLVPARINLDIRTERDPASRQDYVSYSIDDRTPQNGFFYLDLPATEKGSRLQYYGGYLKYLIRIDQHSRDLAPMPDVILEGNGYTLIYTSDVTPEPSTPTEIKVRFWPGQWFKVLRGGISEDYEMADAFYREVATREDLMRALENIEHILIRVQYHRDSQVSVSLMNVILDTAISPSRLAPFKPQAVYVEQCQCPRGYNGLSCQDCAPGFGRDPDNRCVSVSQESCPPGYYGNPSVGIECQVCPCAQVQAGYIAECYLETDFQVRCRCPYGYEGRRCEQCSPGFMRQQDNQCVPAVAETCPSGYYGNPPSGLECRPCPCVRTPEGYTAECRLDNSYQVQCLCPAGYGGVRCEQCAPGYVSYSPGTPCVRDLQCNYPIGSLTPRPNVATGRCQCKANYYGDLCYDVIPYAPQCQEDEFMSNEGGTSRCISCFCMGVPTNGRPTRCQASDWIRDREVAIFTDDSLKFGLTDILAEADISDLRVDRRNLELVFEEVTQLPPDRKYFWRLPVQFIGNKLGSYGGYLTFTLSQDRRIPDPQREVQVVIRGNGIQLDHFARPSESGGKPQFQVLIHESEWARDDGQKTGREHLLMALADLSHVLIEALEDSREVTRVGIKDVSLSVSLEQSSGNETATSVEQCTCPQGKTNLVKKNYLATKKI